MLGARAMRFCFALDGTLVNCVDDDFEDASPIHKNIQIARRDLGVLHAIDATRGHLTMMWVVSSLILSSAQGPRGARL